MSTEKNKELANLIGRRLRQEPELSPMKPLPIEIEQQIEMLKRMEARPCALSQSTRAPLNDD